jgi:hypothetical protein
LHEAFVFMLKSTFRLSCCCVDVEAAAEILALKAMSISRMARYGMGTIVSNGTLSVASRPFLRYRKLTYVAFFSPSSPSVKPTSLINFQVAWAAFVCASTQACSGPPMIVPNGSACRADIATVDGVVSILFFAMDYSLSFG